MAGDTALIDNRERETGKRKRETGMTLDHSAGKILS